MTIKWIPDNQIGEVQKDGTFTRAASYGVSMINAYFFQELALLNPDHYHDELKQIIDTEAKLVPSLKALDIIGFFSPEEWLQTDHQGRLMIILIYLLQEPSAVDAKTLKQIKQVYPSLTSSLKIMADEIVKKAGL